MKIFTTIIFILQNSVSFLFNNIKKQKIISISPSGLKGYYLLGLSSYIKKKYNLKNYVFSGCSSGSWISLLLTYKGNYNVLMDNILKTSKQNNKNIIILGKKLKHMLLSNYKNDDFDLNKVYISVIEIGIRPKKIIYSNFKTLEEAIDCCIASSHVPFVMGDIFRKYDNKNFIDGGFDSFPYLEGNNVLFIEPYLWLKNLTTPEFFMDKFFLFLELFFVSKYNFTKNFLDGYNFSFKNKDKLDKIFL